MKMELMINFYESAWRMAKQVKLVNIAPQLSVISHKDEMSAETLRWGRSNAMILNSLWKRQNSTKLLTSLTSLTSDRLNKRSIAYKQLMTSRKILMSFKFCSQIFRPLLRLTDTLMQHIQYSEIISHFPHLTFPPFLLTLVSMPIVWKGETDNLIKTDTWLFKF